MAVPQLDNFCETLFDGRNCFAKVIKVDSHLKTFDVKMSFGEMMYNIPFDKFKYSPDLGNLIVNMIEDKYKLGLFTVDASAMTDDINNLIKNKKWMI